MLIGWSGHAVSADYRVVEKLPIYLSIYLYAAAPGSWRVRLGSLVRHLARAIMAVVGWVVRVKFKARGAARTSPVDWGLAVANIQKRPNVSVNGQKSP